MLQNLLYRETLLLVLAKHALDQALQIVAQRRCLACRPAPEQNRVLSNLFLHLVLVLVVEGIAMHCEQAQDDAEAPYIRLLVVGPAVYDFRR